MISKIKEISLSEAKKISNSWGNRNALHVDVTGKVAEVKSDIGLFLDYFMGVIDDDSDEMRKYNFLVPNLAVINYGKLEDDKIYSPGKGIDGIGFVRLNDKNSYILELKNEILESLENFYLKGEVSYYLTELKDFFDKGFIDKSEILDTIHVFLRKKSGIIMQLLIDNSMNFKYLSTKDLDILSWGITNNQIILNILNLIKFNDQILIDDLTNRLCNRDLKNEMFSSFLGLSENN